MKLFNLFKRKPKKRPFETKTTDTFPYYDHSQIVDVRKDPPK